MDIRLSRHDHVAGNARLVPMFRKTVQIPRVLLAWAVTMREKAQNHIGMYYNGPVPDFESSMSTLRVVAQQNCHNCGYIRYSIIHRPLRGT